jgi:urease accessory protein
VAARRLIDTIVASPIARPAAAGRGHLCVIRCGPRSVVSRACASSPLKLLTPRNQGSAAWVYSSTYGGGLVDGDAIDLTVAVGEAAAAFLGSQASTKVYRSPAGTRSRLTARVGAGGTFVVSPDPVVCFAEARYDQRQEFDLEPGASLVVVDWLSCGRRARGERWAFTEYRSVLRIRQAGRLICHDALALRADDGVLVERFGRFDTMATVVLAGPAVRPDVERLMADESTRPPARRADRLIAIAPLPAGGCLVRLVGVSLEDVGRIIRSCVEGLPAVLGDDPWARKW